MIQKILKSEIYESRHGWLISRFLFSFAEYFDRGNMSFGSLRVFNDDLIAPHSGFGDHPHKEMEIVTIMHSGTLTHTDSMGNKKVIRKGDVQRMSAGTGIVHAEVNEGDEEVSLYQLWFMPEKGGVSPSYEEKTIEEKDGFTVLVSQEGREGSLTIGTDAEVLRLLLTEKEKEFEYDTKGMKTLIYVRSGSAVVEGVRLESGDELRIEGEGKLAIAGDAGTLLFIVHS